MAIEWFCKIAGREFGPLSAAELRAMVSEGSLTPSHVVRRGREGDWCKAGQVKGLFHGADEAAWSASVDGLETKPAEKPLPRAKPMPTAQAAPAKGAAPQPAAPAAHVPPAPPHTTAPVPMGVPVGQMPPQPLRPGAAAPHAVAYPHAPAPGTLQGHRSGGAEEAGHLGKRRKKNNTLFMVGLGGVLLTAVIAVVALAWPRGDDEATKPLAKKAAGAKDKDANGGDPFSVKKSDEPKEAKPGETAAESPAADWKGEVKWVDAAKEAIRRGDVEVRLVQVGQGKPVWLSAADGARKGSYRNPVLMIRLSLTPAADAKGMNYVPWGVGEGVTLTDNVGRTIAPARKPGLVPDGQLRAKKVTIDDPLEDLLVFELPKEKFKHLRLLLPGKALGQPEPLGFEISPLMLREFEPPKRPGSEPDGPDPAGMGRTTAPKPDEEKPAPAEPAATKPPSGLTPEQEALRKLNEDIEALKKESDAKKTEP